MPMTKISIFFLLLLLQGCGKTDEKVIAASSSAGDEELANEYKIPGSDLPELALSFAFNVELIDMSTSDEDKLHRSMELVGKVIGTKAFRDGILNHTYNGAKTFVDNGGYTNAQIYKKILDAAEKLFPTRNNAMDMQIELYTDTGSNVVGYTYPSSPRIWMNIKYFNSYTSTGATANLTHEWLHKIGFGHAVSYSTSRDYSVPYAVGRLVAKIAATLD